MNSEKIFGLVLAGGKSTRMGSEKRLLSYHGLPQQEYLFNCLKQFCHEVFTSCNALQSVPSALNPLPDKFDIQSPLNGIITALDSQPQNAWLVVAVDMPNVNTTVIEQLMSHRDKGKVATCFYNNAEKFPEPLLTIWEPNALPLLHAFVSAGRKSPRDFLRENNIQLVTPPIESALLNINSIDQYLAFKQQN